MKNFILSVFVTLAMFACTKDQEKDLNIFNEDQNKVTISNIPKTQYNIALDNMMNLLKEIYPEKYSYLSSQRYSLKTDVYTTKHLNLLQNNKQYTQSFTEETLDTLLYIVNFGIDEGFAVMSAKDESTVYAITDKGNISIEDFQISTDTNNIQYNTPSVAVASLLTRSFEGNIEENPNPNPGTNPNLPIYV